MAAEGLSARRIDHTPLITAFLDEVVFGDRQRFIPMCIASGRGGLVNLSVRVRGQKQHLPAESSAQATMDSCPISARRDCVRSVPSAYTRSRSDPTSAR